MSKLTTRFTLTAAALMLAATIALPAGAADPMYRTFTGRIDKVNKKQMIVDNRMGDKVKFIYAKKETAVEGTKSEWKKLKTKDWVTVSWLFKDNPRKAYKILVFDKTEDEGAEE
jgi:hypothetical protein